MDDLSRLIRTKSLTLEDLAKLTGSAFDSTLLYYICENKKLTIERLMLVKDHDFNLRNNNTGTPLHALCANTSLTADILRLVAGNDFNIKNMTHLTPLHALCGNKSLTAEMLQIVKGDFTKMSQFADTPLHYLCQNPSLTPEMLKVVVYEDFSVKDFRNRNPLCWIYGRSEFDEVVKYIIFPYRNTKYYINLINYPKWSEFRESQRGITADNFRYLEPAVKESTVVLLLSLKRVGVRLPKYLVWMIVTKMF